MKKRLSVCFLILALCIITFSACGSKTFPPKENGPTAENRTGVKDEKVDSSKKQPESGNEYTGTFHGFSDTHTIEVAFEDETTAFQIYQEDIQNFLGTLKEGTSITFQAVTDEETGSREILKILNPAPN